MKGPFKLMTRTNRFVNQIPSLRCTSKATMNEHQEAQKFLLRKPCDQSDWIRSIYSLLTK